ncbi:MAG: hypothetical protein ACOYNY_47455 [Caldilineaceae bacterium]
MTVTIDYQSRDFPTSYRLTSGTLLTSWNEILWSALTIGRPSTYHVFRHGPASFNEAIFRLALIRMAVEQVWHGSLRRTDAYAALDPTEKGMVSYFIGMVLCKLFASRLLHTPWLLHLDVFRAQLNPILLGRSRPDLVGEDFAGKWHTFESKGRSSAPSANDKAKAKSQAQRLVSVGGTNCTLHIGSFAYFRKDILEFYWRDPEPNSKEAVKTPEPNEEWRYYFEPALLLAEEADAESLAAERQMADVKVEIHPEIHLLLRLGEWLSAKRRAQELSEVFAAEGFQPDGLRVTAGDSWAKRFERRERG